MEARIIKLGPQTQVTRVMTFDEAFEGHSNIFGLGKSKAQRQEQKMQRIENKKQRKLAKTTAKREVKSAKQAARGEKKLNRLAIKGAKQQARQDNRTNKVSARQGRRTLRKGMKLDRRAMNDQDLPEDPNLEMGYDENQPAYEDDTQGQLYDNGGEYADDYQGEGDDYGGDGYDAGGGAEDAGNEDDTQYDGAGEQFYEEDPFYDDDESGYSEDDVYNFDGPMNDFADEVSEGKKNQLIPLPVQNIADKIQWNQEYIVRLDAKMNDLKIKVPEENVDEYETEILEKKNRVNELKDMLDKFVNFAGDFDSQGDFMLFSEQLPEELVSDADGKAKMQKRIAGRRNMVRRANNIAKQKRAQITTVKTSLNPVIENGRVVVPAKDPSASNFTGTGVTGLDNQDDFDAPPALTVELDSNFSGKNINVAGVIAGVGIAAIGIWALKHYKVI